MGIPVDNETILTVIQSLCAICVLLGILNNPDSTGNE